MTTSYIVGESSQLKRDRERKRKRTTAEIYLVVSGGR